MEICLKCLKEIEGKSPYSLCFDPDYVGNTWGGDSHDYIGFFCVECGDELKMFAEKIEKYQSNGRD